MKVLLLCVFLALAFAHPPTTFDMALSTSNGTVQDMLYPGGETSRVYFVITDRQNNNAFVSWNKLMKMHGKFIHVQISSPDLTEFYHIHPEDYGSLIEMSDNGAYFVDVFLPKHGGWAIGISFSIMVGMNTPQEDTREGTGSTYIFVTRTPKSIAPSALTWNRVSTKKFRGYPIPSGNSNVPDLFYAANNTDPNGYEVTIASTSGYPTSNITGGCQAIKYSIKDRNGNPMTKVVPYLMAAGHLAFIAPGDTIYHAHAMPSYDTPFRNLMAELPALYNGRMGSGLNQSDLYLFNDLIMIGAQLNQSLTCINDMAKVMMYYNMSMSEWEGQAYMGPDFYAVFDFPLEGQKGVDWKMWLQFAVEDAGNIQLIVADFDMHTWTNSTNIGGVSGSDSDMLDSGADMVGAYLHMIVIALIAILFA